MKLLAKETLEERLNELEELGIKRDSLRKNETDRLNELMDIPKVKLDYISEELELDNFRNMKKELNKTNTLEELHMDTFKEKLVESKELLKTIKEEEARRKRNTILFTAGLVIGGAIRMMKKKA